MTPPRVYEVLIERSVEHTLKRLPRQIFVKIVTVIKDLEVNPRPSGCRMLAGGDSDWRVRVGDYRVLYEIDDGKRIVRILHVRHRREAYR
jgi:mRNA interferase RelE/StbE